MLGYPQFSFWVLTALAKICFFRIVINRAKMLLYSLRSRRDRSRAQRFGLVEEKKPRGEWEGDALNFLAPSALASRGKAARMTASPPKLRAQIQFRQLCRVTIVLGGKFLKKTEYPEMRRTYAQYQKEAPSIIYFALATISSALQPIL